MNDKAMMRDAADGAFGLDNDDLDLVLDGSGPSGVQPQPPPQEAGSGGVIVAFFKWWATDAYENPTPPVP